MKYLIVPFPGTLDTVPTCAFVRYSSAMEQRIRALRDISCLRHPSLWLFLLSHEVELVWGKSGRLEELVDEFVNEYAWGVVDRLPALGKGLKRAVPYAVSLCRNGATEGSELFLYVKVGANTPPVMSIGASWIMER
jgi:hypothetical protein